MAYSKYLKSLILFIVSIVLVFVILFLALQNVPGFILLFPISLPVDSLIMNLLTAFIAIIFGYYFGYILGPLLIFVHKKTIGRKMIYGIEEKPLTKKFKGYYIKALWPALLSINIALILANYTWVSDLITSVPTPMLQDPNTQWATFMAILPITTAASLILFSPILHLIDSGIIYHNKDKTRDTFDSTEVRNIGSWYNTLLKGYAGISVFYLYFNFFSKMIEKMASNPDLISGIASILTLLMYPILITILIIPAIIILDKTREKRRTYLLKKVKKFQIEQPMEIEIK
ncbi:hypothetical protein LCGC14_1227650 [marine sediment metagenome]|uniref:Uncharacterized protein n=1 Tax=marine sediment metagenome TaxID=412755 RepID=A0A0F9LDI1_9ZZZZ